MVTGLEVVMPVHGVVEIEGFVGGLYSAELGQTDDQANFPFLCVLHASLVCWPCKKCVVQTYVCLRGAEDKPCQNSPLQDMNYGWASIGVATGSAGAGPFTDGTTSIFQWPANSLSGIYFRFTIKKTWHQKKWAIYRAFPIFSSRTKEVHGMDVPPRFATVYAGVENWLHGIRIDDLDIGEDAVQGYYEDSRRIKVTVECERGELFVNAPYTGDHAVISAQWQPHMRLVRQCSRLCRFCALWSILLLSHSIVQTL